MPRGGLAREVEEPAGVGGGDVDASVALRVAEVPVPVGTVDGDGVIEELDVRDVLERVVRVEVIALDVVHVGHP
jgi:hypothetical protein